MSAALASKPKLRLVADELRAKPTSRRAVHQERRVSTYSTHPAVGLTVEMLLSYFREAERGSPVRQFDCFEDLVEIDGHLRSQIEARNDSVSACEMVIKAGRSDKPSQLCAGALSDRLGEIQFRPFIEHQLTAMPMGLALTNVVWDTVEGAIAPIELRDAAHRCFASPNADRAHEVWYVNGDNVHELIDLEPGLWAMTRYRGRNPWSAGLMRTCAWWSMIKRWSVRDWQVFAEMFGIPLAIGFYEENAGQQSRTALEDAIKMLGEDGYAILADTCEIVLKEAARGGDSSTVYPGLVALAEAQISKLLTGGTMNTDIGSKGSYAAGAIHEARQYMLARADARRIEGMFQQHIGMPFKIWNGFDRAAAPHLSIKITRDNLERAKVLQIIGQVIDLDEDQLREEFSIRVPAKPGIRFQAKAPAAGGGDA